MEKTVRVGRGECGNVFCRIKIGADGELTISGVEGPTPNGDARGGCGQIIDAAASRDLTLAPGWTPELQQRFVEIWQRWHLNHMRPGCEHQRAEGWDKRPIDPSKPLRSYGLHFEGQKSARWNMCVWVRPDEHPEGLLAKPCDVCGYKYGSAWLFEELPEDVVAFLESLPDTDVQPAWV